MLVHESIVDLHDVSYHVIISVKRFQKLKGKKKKIVPTQIINNVMNLKNYNLRLIWKKKKLLSNEQGLRNSDKNRFREIFQEKILLRKIIITFFTKFIRILCLSIYDILSHDWNLFWKTGNCNIRTKKLIFVENIYKNNDQFYFKLYRKKLIVLLTITFHNNNENIHNL